MTTPERELLQKLYDLLRRMEACPGHDLPSSGTGVAMHHHYDASRIGRPDTVEKTCTVQESEAREVEYARLMGRVKQCLASGPS